MKKRLDAFRIFSAVNRARNVSPEGFNHPIDAWSLSDWMTALTGELGEAANVVKKLNRVRDGMTINRETEDQLRTALAEELADTFIYLDLLVQAAGLDLLTIVADKFNKTSQKLDMPFLIEAPTLDGGAPPA